MKEDIKVDLTELKNIPQQNWDKLANKKIYFGHQSIGFNIIDGLNDIIHQLPNIKMNIKKTNAPNDFSKPVFAHSAIGTNRDPVSKCEEFKRIIEKGVGDKVDIAFFKFCYVDITTDTDLEKVFSTYKNIMAKLSKRYKNTIFIHVTVPLRTLQTGPKAWIKKIIGRPIGYYDNIKRNQFNEMLIKEYEHRAPIFDLAKIESTFPDGRRMEIEKDGKIFYAMVPDYTYDGGHLNEAGRKKVAEQLLVLLVDVL